MRILVAKWLVSTQGPIPSRFYPTKTWILWIRLGVGCSSFLVIRTYMNYALLRLLVFDELRPITELTTAAVLSKAFCEIFKCMCPCKYPLTMIDWLMIGYKWLYQTADILHQDISIHNLMYRRKGEEICGLLNKFDLATIQGDSSPSSKQRTGMKPYMGRIQLLRETKGDPVVYSWPWITILILTSCFEDGKEISDLPLQELVFPRFPKNCQTLRTHWLHDSTSLPWDHLMLVLSGGWKPNVCYIHAAECSNGLSAVWGTCHLYTFNVIAEICITEMSLLLQWLVMGCNTYLTLGDTCEGVGILQEYAKVL